MTTDFDLAVIGGGAAGLAAAGIGAHLGAKTLLVEQERLGGDCTWYGCIPSKTLLNAARAAHAVRRGHPGISPREPEIDFGRVMQHVRDTRERVYRDADAPERYQAMGIDVRLEAARFVDERTISVSSTPISARYFVIATGASPAVPPIEGIGDVRVLTNETVFDLDVRPSRLLVIGAGPVGIETAQAFRRLGSEVTVIERSDRILPKDDPELAALLQHALESEGVRFLLNADIRSAGRDDHGVHLDLAGRPQLIGDALFVAAGRTPNVSNLGLNAAGVEYAEAGIRIDDRCRTSVSHIYAAGDVTGRFPFTHMAEHMAKTAAMNALLKLPSTIEADRVPWVTFTDPELAQVGATEDMLRREGRRFETFRFPYERIDRATTDLEPRGLIKVYARKWSGRILGASIIGHRAGDLIAELGLAMRSGISLRQVADTIHPYPTYSLGVRRAADQWYVRRRSPRLIRTLKAVFGYRGPVLEYDPEEIL